jgi:hypothetical protein
MEKKKLSYSPNHIEDECDRCLDKVGKNNLYRVPFLYKDCNDKIHEDEGNEYRQYYVCKKCFLRL